MLNSFETQCGVFTFLLVSSCYFMTLMIKVDFNDYVFINNIENEDLKTVDKFLIPATSAISEVHYSVVIMATDSITLPCIRLAQQYATSPQVDSVFVVWDYSLGNPPSPMSFQIVDKRIEVVDFNSGSDAWNNKFRIRTTSIFWTFDTVSFSPEAMTDAFSVWKSNRNSLVGFIPASHQGEQGNPNNQFDPHPISEGATHYTFLYPPFFVPTNILDKLAQVLRLSNDVKNTNNRLCHPFYLNALFHSRNHHGPLVTKATPSFWEKTSASFEPTPAPQNSYMSEVRDYATKCLSSMTRIFSGVPYREIKYQTSVGKPEEPNQILPARYGYVTLISQDNYILPAVVWAKFLRSTNTTADLILLCFDEAFESISGNTNIKTYFDYIVSVPEIKNPYNVNGFSKIHCWELLDYQKVIFIDVDTVILSNMDELFHRPQLTASPDCSISDKFNSGLIVIVPSLTFFEDLTSKVFQLPSYNGGDQGFFNSYFSSWYNSSDKFRLPYRYNTVLYFPPRYGQPRWLIDNESEISVRLAIKGFPKMIHFANPWFKPWFFPESIHSDSWHGVWWKMKETVEIPTNTEAMIPSSFTSNKVTRPVQWKPKPERELSFTNAKNGQLRFFKECFSRKPIAMATYMDGTHYDNNILPALVWSVGARSVSSQWTLVLLVGPTTGGSEWNKKDLAIVAEYYDEVILVPTMESPLDELHINVHDFKGYRLHTIYGLHIIHLWYLLQYQKVLYVSVISQLVNNIDHIPEHYQPFAAAPNVIPPDHFSVTVMLIEPSKQTFQDLIQALYYQELPLHEGSIEAFLNKYFDGWFEHTASHRLPMDYRAEYWFKHQLVKDSPVSVIENVYMDRPWVWFHSLYETRPSNQLWCIRYESLPSSIRSNYNVPVTCLKEKFNKAHYYPNDQHF